MEATESVGPNHALDDGDDNEDKRNKIETIMTTTPVTTTKR